MFLLVVCPPPSPAGFDPKLAHCPVRRKNLVTNRKKQEGWPDCLYTRKQLLYITEKLRWTMEANGHGIPPACKGVWEGTERGGTGAVPVQPIEPSMSSPPASQ